MNFPYEILWLKLCYTICRHWCIGYLVIIILFIQILWLQKLLGQYSIIITKLNQLITTFTIRLGISDGVTFCVEVSLGQYCMGCVQWGLQLGQSSNLFVEGIQTWSRIYSADSFYMCTLVKLWSRKCGFKARGVFSFLFGLTRVITLHLTFYVCVEYSSEFLF